MEEYKDSIREGYNNKLKNKLFGLLCEYEKGREWEKFLDSILIELMGFEEQRKTINYYILFFSNMQYPENEKSALFGAFSTAIII